MESCCPQIAIAQKMLTQIVLKPGQTAVRSKTQERELADDLPFVSEVQAPNFNSKIYPPAREASREVANIFCIYLIFRRC